MKSNHWIDSSRRIYARLLGLYPQEYRAEYGETMLQLFGDLCQDTVKEHGKLGILVLWIHTLVDLGKTTIHEHLTRSGIKKDSVSASPDSPLPWKEIGLVLLPGLAFLLAYALMVLTNRLTFSSIFQYGTDLLAGIALLYFWRKKRIPVWGLVPLGLLAGRLIAWVNYLPAQVFTRYGMGNFIGTMTILLAALCLLIFQLRKHKFSGSSWVWLGIFLLIGVGRIAAAYAYTIEHRHWNLIALFALPTGNADYLSVYFSNSVFGFAKWFLLILIGTLLARRFGSLAILFLLGLSFSAGMIVFGQDQNTSLYLLTFTYCLLATVVFPIWISRVFSTRKQTFLITMLILLVLVFSTVFDLFVRQGWILSGGSGAPYTPILGVYICLSALLTGAGYLLAISLYRSIAPTIESQPETTILAPK